MRCYWLLIAALFLLYGCPSSGITLQPIPFKLSVASTSFSYSSLPQQPNVIVVGFADLPAPVVGSGQVKITAECLEATVQIYNAEIYSGEYAEIVVKPTGVPVGTEYPAGMFTPAFYVLRVNITGERDGLSDSVQQTIRVYELDAWTGEYGGSVETAYDYYTQWLSDNQPQLGITPGAAHFTVHELIFGPQQHWSYFLYFTDTWEITLEFSEVPYPDGAVTINLRRRYTQQDYSLAFHTDSKAIPPGTPITATTPQTGLMR